MLSGFYQAIYTVCLDSSTLQSFYLQFLLAFTTCSVTESGDSASLLNKMKSYLKTAKKRHWLLILILFTLSCYLPYLIFGAYPFANKTNATQEEVELLTQSMDLTDYYQKNLEAITNDQRQLEENAFANWDGGKCRFCHSIKKNDRDRMAPSLHRILGKPAAVSENFTYSPAMIEMRNNGLIWTPETINAFISNPESYISGNRMRMEGIKDPQTRELIINYIERESQ